MITTMKAKGTTSLNVIYHWTNEDVWDYIRQEGIETNPLYSCGYDRVGCIGCPLAAYRQRIREFSDFPKYRQAYTRAFENMLNERQKRGLDFEWNTGKEVFEWWVEEYKHNVKGQITIEEYMKGKL